MDLIEFAKEFARSFLNMWVDFSIWFLLGMFVASVIEVFFKVSSLNNVGIFKAAVIGVPLPICSCSIVPITNSIVKSGAKVEAAMSFLISTPMTGVDAIIATWAVFGWEFAFLRAGIAFLAGVCGGLLFKFFGEALVEGAEDLEAGVDGKEEKVRLSCNSACCHHHYHEEDSLFHSHHLDHDKGDATIDKYSGKERILKKMNSLVKKFFFEQPAELLDTLLIGLMISAFFSVVFSHFKYIVLKPPLAYFEILFLALPMYVCSVSSVPIAASLVLSGFSVGSAFVFLLAGPATNAITLRFVWQRFKLRGFLVYFGVVVAASLVGAFLVDSLGFKVAFAESSAKGGSYINVISAVLLAAMMGYALIRKLR